MFTELYELIKTGEKLTLELSAGPNGTMKVTVVPALGKSKVPELSLPLMLCATPSELDAGFMQAVMDYQAPRLELSKQVEVTATLLGQAKKEQATKAVKALEAPSKTPKTGYVATNDDEGTGDDENADGDDKDTSKSTPPAASSEVATEVSGSTDLSQFF